MKKTMNDFEEKVRKHPAVESISDERDTGDGIWVYLKAPYYNPELSGTNTATVDDYEDGSLITFIHENSWRKCWSELKKVKEWSMQRNPNRKKKKEDRMNGLSFKDILSSL